MFGVNLSGFFQTLVSIVAGLFGGGAGPQPGPPVKRVELQIFEVWHAAKGQALKKYSEVPTKAQADKVVASLVVLGGTAETRGPVTKVIVANTPAAAPTWADIKKVIRGHEGDIPYMYLDSKGFVTVAVGNLLSTAADAQALSFVNRTTGKAATAAEIQTDFDSVKKQTADMVASKYKPFAALDMPEAARSTLFDSRIAGFETDLKSAFPDYDSYPIRVKGALMDMIFNLGKSGVTDKFPSFTKAIKAKDWTEAAKQSNRTAPVSAARNSAVKQWLEDEAAAVKAAAPKN